MVEARRHRERSKDSNLTSRRERSNKDYTLFVFGDSFADAGNLPRTSEKTVMSRAWFYPYGISDSAHGNRPTGRVSDGMVQSDILGMYGVLYTSDLQIIVVDVTIVY